MAPSPTIRRLLKETAELSASSSNPNPTFHAAPVSDSNLHEWHFTLLGPPSPSPYAGGLYHGRITLPTTYPLKPPNFRFLTPSGRFEVNREICLSISGFHEETWMPAWGVRTALTALRSFMAEKGTAGQVGGMEAKNEVRENLARDSKDWRCEGCGRRTNEEIMQDWWEICKERGVKIEEEMSLEALPEGLNLEARDPKTKVEQQKLETQTPPDIPQPMSSIAAGKLPAERTMATGISPSPDLIPQSIDRPAQPPSSCGPQPPRLAPQSDPQSGPSTAPRPTPTIGNGTSTTHPAPETAGRSSILAPISSTVTLQHSHNTVNNNNRETLPTGGLDRAIGAIVFLLCLMILKKIFFPATSPDSGMGGMYMSGD